MSAVERAPDLHWQARGACASPSVDPEVMFPSNERSKKAVRAAQVVCFACPVRVPCLNDALAEGVRHGIRSGLTSAERRELLSRSVTAQKGAAA